MPARQNAVSSNSTPLIADLDAMLVEPVAIKVLGKNHIIAPITNEQFFLIVKAWQELDDVKRETKSPDVAVMLDKYHKVITIALPKLARKDMDQMSVQQIGALLQIVVGTVTGETYGEKKTLKNIATQHASQFLQ